MGKHKEDGITQWDFWIAVGVTSAIIIFMVVLIIGLATN